MPVFLPPAGGPYNIGLYGFYWTSTLSGDLGHPYYILIDGNEPIHIESNCQKETVMSVRLVKDL